jgi:hypothetical protein
MLVEDNLSLKIEKVLKPLFTGKRQQSYICL